MGQKWVNGVQIVLKHHIQGKDLYLRPFLLIPISEKLGFEWRI